MSDPSKLDPSDWMAAIVAGILAGFGAAFTWFTKTKDRLYSTMHDQEKRMDSYEKVLAEHSVQLAIIHTNQDHMTERLNEIRVETQETNKKLDAIMKDYKVERRNHAG